MPTGCSGLAVVTCIAVVLCGAGVSSADWLVGGTTVAAVAGAGAGAGAGVAVGVGVALGSPGTLWPSSRALSCGLAAARIAGASCWAASPERLVLPLPVAGVGRMTAPGPLLMA
ncbi:MAG: hypothetical protein EBY28_27220 [Betaproteobacteria bacterium]|nr:hypothetical protein [Betaproteobacteria bacterium]